MRRRPIATAVLVLCFLVVAGCADAGRGDDPPAAAATTALLGSETTVVVDVDATYLLADGQEQTQEQHDRSCAAATVLFTDYNGIFTNPIVLAPDELQRQVLGLGQLAMEVHDFAPYDQQDEVTVLTDLAIQLRERLELYEWSWAEMEATDGAFVEMLRREGMDTALISLLSWVVASCPEGTVPFGPPPTT